VPVLTNEVCWMKLLCATRVASSGRIVLSLIVDTCACRAVAVSLVSDLLCLLLALASGLFVPIGQLRMCAGCLVGTCAYRAISCCPCRQSAWLAHAPIGRRQLALVSGLFAPTRRLHVALRLQGDFMLPLQAVRLVGKCAYRAVAVCTCERSICAYRAIACCACVQSVCAIGAVWLRL
jgi:hypothetical protein